MNGYNVRQSRSAWCVFASGAMLIVAGCGTKPESEYQSYSARAHESSPTATSEPATVPRSASEGIGTNVAETDSQPNAGSLKASPAEKNPVANGAAHANVPSTPAADESQTPKVQLLAATVGSGGAPGVEKKTASGAAGRSPVVAVRPGAKGSAPRKTKVLIPTKDFKTEGPDGAVRVSYDDIDLLKVLNMEPVTPEAPKLMPTWLKELDGKRVRIRGFMYPTFQETGLKSFVLARDNQICCFGRDPKIYDVFSVALRSGVTTDYIQNRPFDVVGVFHIRPEDADGELFRLYEIDDAQVIDK